MADINEEMLDMRVKRDESLSIDELLNEMQNSENTATELEATFAQVKEEKSILPNNLKTNENTSETKISQHIEDDGLTPLERLRKQRESNAEKGLDAGVNVETDESPKELKHFSENEERMNEIKERIDEFDSDIEKRNFLVLLKEPIDKLEHMRAMAEINSVKFDLNGEPIIPETLEFFRKRDMKHEDIMGNPIDENGNNIEKKPNESEEIDPNDPVEQLYAQIPDKNKKIAEVLIDKTGLGAEFKFTEEEKEKLTISDEIRVKEIKVIDINAIRSKSSNRSFSDVINSMDTSGIRTDMAFPASGYKAQIKGMSFGEYTDVALDIDTDSGEYGTFDQNYKRLSILYNKITNVSCGSFNSFEDFLKGTSWTDIDLGLYGLLISTESETTSVQLRCGKCHENFEHKYSPRSLIQFKLSGYRFMEKWKDIVVSPPSKYEELHDKSMVSQSTSIELPKSKYIVEVGVASAYEYLYNFIPISEPERFKEEFGDDENDSYRSLIPFLLSVKSVAIPDGQGEYAISNNYKDILEVLYTIPLDDMRVISAYTNKYLDDLSASYAFTNAECPHCKNKMKLIPIEMNELVFQAYRHSMSITIDSKSIQEI